MGMMYFPGEAAREYLPPRDDDGDIVGRFGAWLTDGGATYFAYATCAIPAVMGAYRLFLWMGECFSEGFFTAVFSLFGAAFMIGLAMVPLYLLYFVAYAVAWTLGWICYNKWTLIACLVIAVVVYLWPR